MIGVTVGDLLAEETLRDGLIVGGRTGLDAVVRDVALVVTGAELDTVPYGTAAVFDLGGRSSAHRRQHLVEIVCRRLHGRNGRLLIVAGGPFTPTLSTVRLADRLRLPIVATPGTAPQTLAAGLLALVHAPQAAVGRRLAAGAARLRAAGSLNRVMAVLDAELDGRTSLSTTDGTVLAGTVPRHAVTVPAGAPVPTVERTGQVSTALCPVPGTDDSRLWIVSQSERSGPLWRETALGLLDMGAAYAAAWYAAERLTAERDARTRGGLLTEILALDGPLSPHLAGQAARLGWRLDGWHCGIHITLIGSSVPAPATVTRLLAARLDAHGVKGPLVEQAGGWSGWRTTEQPGSDSVAITAAVHRALGEYHATPNVPPITAGIGRAAAGPAGLVTTLADARRASLVASASSRPGTVQHSDDLGAKRMLLDWYGSQTAREEAEQMLAPLLRDRREALLETVECYLDSGCSTAATAHRLGLHRNTVTRRVHRAEALLGVPLSDPDDRLAVQLACRMWRLDRD
ncbi:helix-turn-helix domain-containing protein [Streptosporangium sp. NPDC051023]|uniref:PucR family transcriptional regulator n=1 Tax=Streptosporangium sp. NPDC051023 TaxID=3155410 RepID=UPI00344F0A3B